MTPNNLCNLTGGTIVCVVRLGVTQAAFLIFEQRFDDGLIRIHLNANGLSFSLNSMEEEIDTVQVSLPNGHESEPKEIIVSWDNYIISIVSVDGEILFPKKVSIDDKTISKTPWYSLKEVSEKACGMRKHKMENYVRNPDRHHGDKSYAFGALGDEIIQIDELIKKIEQGEKAFIPGLVSRIRLCVIGKNPLGLLQLCAAYKNSELQVYTSHGNPSIVVPGSPSASLRFNLSAKPSDLLNNPIDFDAWLEMIGLIYLGRSYPNREIIREIGNTVGSHLDIDIQKSVYFLRSGQSSIGVNINIDNLGRYAVMTGRAVSILSKTLLYNN